MRLCALFSMAAVGFFGATGTAQINAAYDSFGVGCAGTGVGLGSMHIAPAGAANAFGSGNAIPFGWSPNRYQQVFLGSELPSAFAIAAMSLRQPRTGPIAHGFTVDISIRAGYTSRWTPTLSTTFDQNWDSGTPITVLPRSLFVFPDQPLVPPTLPNEFYVTIPWQNVLDWDPALGLNLMIEITTYGNSYGNQITGYPIDNVSGTASLIGTPATATVANVTPVRGFGLALGLIEQTHVAVPRLFSNGTPQIGDTIRISIEQSTPLGFQWLLLGFSRTSWNAVPLPLDLTLMGAPNCALLVDPMVSLSLRANASGASNLELSLPNDIYLLGRRFYNQALILDPLANTLGLVSTNGGVGFIGNQ